MNYRSADVIASLTEYQDAAMRTADMAHGIPMLINASLGLCGEAGEFADMVKKAIYQGHDISREKLAHEVGDILWYCALAALYLGIDLDRIAYMNIAKLQERYPNGFEPSRSINRHETH